MDFGHMLPLTSTVAGRTPAADLWYEQEIATNIADGLIFQKIDGQPVILSRRIPAPPTTGTHTLKAINGVMQWVAD